MSDKVVFHLKRIWEGKDLWEEIKSGRKTSEYREMTYYWIKRLCYRANWIVNASEPQDLTKFLKVRRAWFVVGYPKGNLPRLEADIIGLFCDPLAMQLEIKFSNVSEISVNGVRSWGDRRARFR